MTTIFEDLIRCAYCKGLMKKRGHRPISDGPEVEYFSCTRRTGAEPNGCNARQIAYKPMEAAVFGRIVDTTPLEQPVPEHKAILKDLEYQYKVLVKHIKDPYSRDGIIEWLKAWVAKSEQLETDLKAAQATEEVRIGLHVRAPVASDVERIWIATYVNEHPEQQKLFGLEPSKTPVKHYAEIHFKDGTMDTSAWT